MPSPRARSSPSPQSPLPPPTVVPVERVYVLGLVSLFLLLLLIVVAAALVGGQLRRQAARVSEQSLAIDQLREELAQVREEVARLEAGRGPAAAPPRAARSAPPSAAASEPAFAGPDGAARREAPARTLAQSGAQPALAPAALPSGVGEERVRSLLARALRTDDEAPVALADRAAAEQAVTEALSSIEPAAWSGETWARLAAAACLLDQADHATLLAARAEASGQAPAAYYRILAGRRIAEGRAADALTLAERLAAVVPGDPSAAVLRGVALWQLGDAAAAHAAVEGVDDPAALSLSEKLLLGRLLIWLERWDQLEHLLAWLSPVPESTADTVSFLRAVLATQRGSPAEAVALLDNLLARQPDDYDLRTWRGVALLEARQLAAAREALAHAEQHPERPEAWYWRGMVELRAGNVEQATAFFQHALAACEQFAPAAEALATIALNAGELAAATQFIDSALRANWRRPAAHFLRALVCARQTRAAEAARALREAFALDPALLQTARQTPVISELFTPDELAALAGQEPGAPNHGLAGPE